MQKATACLLALLFSVAFSIDAPAFPRGGGGAHRLKATAVQRAVGKRARKLFRPRLVIARNSIGTLQAVATDDNEQFLAVAAGNGHIRLWNMAAGREQAALYSGDIYHTISFSKNARYLVGYSARKAACWDITTSKRLWKFDSSDHLLAVYMHKQSLILVDRQGVMTTVALDADRTQQKQLLVQPVAVTLLAGGEQFGILTAQGRLHVFDAYSGHPVAQKNISVNRPNKLVASPKGNLIAALNSRGDIAIWDISQDRLIKRLQLSRGKVHLSAIHTDGSLLIAGKKGDLSYFDASRHWKERRFSDGLKDITAMKLGRKAEFAIFTTRTGFVELWNLAAGRRQLQLVSTRSGWAAVAADGRFDGDVNALNDIEWRDKKVAVTVNAFSETHFSPGLLARAITVAPKPIAVKNLREGVLMPPDAALRKLSQADGRVKIELQATERDGGGIVETRLYLNGKLVTHPPEREVIQPKNITRHYTIELAPGNNVFEAVAFNTERLEGVSDRLVLKGPGAGKLGKLHLVVVGINRYADSRLDLNYAIGDAGGVIAALKTSQGPFSGIEVHYLQNEAATKSAILAGLRYLQGLPREDGVFIYYAGHGLAVGDEWYLLSHEATGLSGRTGWKKYAISIQELRVLIEGAGPDRIFMAIDACQSGQAVDVMSRFRGIRSLRMLARTVGVHVLSATTSKQFATEVDSLGHGVFTFSLLRALEGLSDVDPADGHVRAVEIMRHVEREVPPLSRQYADQEQFPTLHSRGNDYDVLYRHP